jgi:hypothetical protein
VVFKQTGDCHPAIYAEPWLVTQGSYTEAEPAGTTLPLAASASDPSFANASVIVFAVPNGVYRYNIIDNWQFDDRSGMVTA